MSLELQEKILSFLENNQNTLSRVERILSMLINENQMGVIDINEASRLTGYEPTYLYKLSSVGTLKTEKRGGKLLFDKANLEVWFLTKQKKGGLK